MEQKINIIFGFFLSGKQKCAHDASHILRVLSDLLGHENQEVYAYMLFFVEISFEEFLCFIRVLTNIKRTAQKIQKVHERLERSLGVETLFGANVFV